MSFAYQHSLIFWTLKNVKVKSSLAISGILPIEICVQILDVYIPKAMKVRIKKITETGYNCFTIVNSIRLIFLSDTGNNLIKSMGFLYPSDVAVIINGKCVDKTISFKDHGLQYWPCIKLKSATRQVPKI